MVMQTVPVERGVSQRGLWQALAVGVAAGLPVPYSLDFDVDTSDLFVHFWSSSDLDAWLPTWGRPQMCVRVVEDQEGVPTAWLYRPDEIAVEWLGWSVYPSVVHQLTPEMLAGPVEGGRR